MASVLAYCRAGYENDTANELTTWLAEKGVYGYPMFRPGDAYVLFHQYDTTDNSAAEPALEVNKVIFARQLIHVIKHLSELDREDRIGPILDALKTATLPFNKAGDIVIEYPDTEEGKNLAKFCRKFLVPLRQTLRKHGLLSKQENHAKPRLHIFFTDFDNCHLGYSLPAEASEFAMGICRLRFPSDAPSRSTLKLEEALLSMLNDSQRQRVCRRSGRAVDLGACPGGWTYQLVQREMFVEAVDNGSIDETLMSTGQIEHFAADGFSYRPQMGRVDLLVCDMIEKPDRVADLMGDWLVRDWCDHAVFNLKLPMKKRFETVTQALDALHEKLRKLHDTFYIRARHLYHDRDEVTVVVVRN
ncbi:23S rRNA (cytidine(2498)-2'-O)-methyltransferase RlmM [Alteromonas halophila]|uniref:Ribosomal RNA large subunit methyltransferase M n=1 Tax=Alteromonas halophila TaxID=516698 RepID=A0A918JDN9_9ALTE|nr:23S rRNA (cytidine(2498)-2'-O)-methyltransferase RlmM [Alteromonas halophila]GGW76047.1 ribosomal RNA large subunit methyltransferase M [Alteromonas halophila]